MSFLAYFQPSPLLTRNFIYLIQINLDHIFPTIPYSLFLSRKSPNQILRKIDFYDGTGLLLYTFFRIHEFLIYISGF